ncbi:ABC transporter ATP-binding protein [Microbacterium sp. 2FI]|uniref:ABC transporter ATP-binding protein n=1 Tax=Microbacterium sp. 2FI TaxID=2502193 RepID=UPI0010F71742|nr:ABC transporter ATP-binding protein [Microbacterium sp. 2FI]
MTATLEVHGLTKLYGGVRAVDDVSFTVEPGHILGLIGPNGSGKTTLLNMIAGTTRPTAGSIRLAGGDVTALPPHRKSARGITRTFQTTRVMPTWTVEDSLALAAGRGGMGVSEVATDVGIDDVLDRGVGDLSNAQQRLVMVGCALASRPAAILLDEPAVGMGVGETDHLSAVVRGIRDHHGISVIVVEHNMRFLMALADSVVVMATGSVLSAGRPEIVRNDPAVIAAYLGG